MFDFSHWSVSLPTWCLARIRLSATPRTHTQEHTWLPLLSVIHTLLLARPTHTVHSHSRNSPKAEHALAESELTDLTPTTRCWILAAPPATGARSPKALKSCRLVPVNLPRGSRILLCKRSATKFADGCAKRGTTARGGGAGLAAGERDGSPSAGQRSRFSQVAARQVRRDGNLLFAGSDERERERENEWSCSR